MSKKYSIVMPYLKRSEQLKNTIASFIHHYKDRDDYELVIVEDVKNRKDVEEHEKLLKTLKFFDDYADKVCIESEFFDCYNPAPLFNLGVEKSRGEFIVITNPEVMHHGNVLEGLDKAFAENKDQYVVCSCLNVVNYNELEGDIENFYFEPQMWYQHSKHRNAMFHFCSAISKVQYERIGGFDEIFSLGVAYDDDDFRETVKRNNIPFYLADDLLTLHQAHDSAFNIPDFEKRLRINKTIYYLKLQGKSKKEILEFIGEIN